MTTQNFQPHKTLVYAFLLLFFVNTAFTDTRTRTPAKILAKQTGATQFEEERYENPADCNEHKHHLKKRASDEDIDYEVYQGVVGRPGIDFPIYPRIPRTSFSCRSYGNGYFADMETDCQVFHICEEGRKISFLCPNGTIFQQSELTCDWWFKVNCLGSSGFYAESSEILNKQRLQRVRPSVPVQGFNIVGGGLNIKPKVASVSPRSRNNKSDRRIDSNEEPSVEAVDFDDISGEKQLRGQPKKIISDIDNNSNDNESQVTAETASFVGGRGRNNYDIESRPDDRDSNRSGGTNTKRGSSPRKGYVNNFSNESTEKARNGHRGNQRFKEDNGKEIVLPGKIVKPIVPLEVGQKPNNGFSITTAPDSKVEKHETPFNYNTPKSSTPTPFFPSGTYSTARRLDTTRTTAYYTPTVPTISKAKSTDGKAYYIKGNSGFSATTPNPNRFNTGSGSAPFLESSSTLKTNSGEQDTTSTFRPIVIGMRHNYDDAFNNQRIVFSPNTKSNLDISSSQKSAKESREYLPKTTVAPTGPTYLPKSASTPKGIADAGGESFLFAPSPAEEESVSRNVNEMLKTMSIIKDKLEDAEDIKARAGLEIPPSSGPDALISLAKYFATEQNGSSSNSIKELEEDKPNKAKTNSDNSATSSQQQPSQSLKPSDTTATLTTSAPSVTVKANDIRAGLLREKTVSQYTDLFGLEKPSSRSTTTDPSEGLLSKPSNTTTSREQGTVTTFFPQIGTTDATIRELASKKESRKIAQVFSNALNTYLEDPKTFREQLASIRPTEPPPTGRTKFESLTTTDKPLFKSGTAASYLPTRPTTSGKGTTTQSNIAAEINSKFDFSTLSPDLFSTTEVVETTTFKSTGSGFEKNQKLKLAVEDLLPPNADSAESGDEFLQREQTQAFVKSRNNYNYENVASKKQADQKLPSIKPTENPWNQIAHTDFLDPLTINDGLMKEARTTTVSPFTYLPKETTTPIPLTFANGKLQVLSNASQRSKATRFGSAEVTTPRPSYGSGRSQDSDSWHDILNSYDLPVGSLPSSSGLQRIANKLFGGLNENEALHLKNVMQQAEHNRQVLSLLLLLIQTCDDQNGRALERSRKHLLNALIDMDGKLQKGKGKTSHHKGGSIATTTTRVPVTTYRRGNEEGQTSTVNYPSTTTDLPSTTSSGSVEETTRFEIRVVDPDEDIVSTTTASNTNANQHSSSDRRALELLKSLYSLASKFSSSR